MGIAVTSQVISSSSQIAGSPPAASPAAGQTFDKIFAGIQRAIDSKDLLGAKLHADITATQQKLAGQKSINAAELLSYQMKAQDFGLRVELVSKVAESVLSTVRKLQNNQ